MYASHDFHLAADQPVQRRGSVCIPPPGKQDGQGESFAAETEHFLHSYY